MTIIERIASINAVETNEEKQECWIDEKGGKHYIERNPINWKIIIEKGGERNAK